MVITSANSIPVPWYSRLIAHAAQVASLRGWSTMPTDFAKQDLADVRLDHSNMG